MNVPNEIDRLQAVVEEHLPETIAPEMPDTSVPESHTWALLIGKAEMDPYEHFGYRGKKDAEYLSELKGLLTMAMTAFDSLTPKVRAELVRGTSNKRNLPRGTYAALRDITATLKSRWPCVESAIEAAALPGRMELRSKAVADACLFAWETCRPGEGLTFNEAPTPLRNFLVAVFDVFGIEADPSWAARKALELRETRQKGT